MTNDTLQHPSERLVIACARGIQWRLVGGGTSRMLRVMRLVAFIRGDTPRGEVSAPPSFRTPPPRSVNKKGEGMWRKICRECRCCCLSSYPIRVGGKGRSRKAIPIIRFGNLARVGGAVFIDTPRGDWLVILSNRSSGKLRSAVANLGL